MLRRIDFVGIDRNGLVPFGFYGAEDPIPDPVTDPPVTDPVVDPPDPTTTDDDAEDDDKKTYSAAEMKRARNDAAKYRTRLRDLEKADEERKKSEMTETDRLKAEKEEADKKAAKAEKELAKERINSAITAAATAARFADPTDAHAFIDVASITVTDDGKPDGRSVKAAVDKLAKDKPHLVTPIGSGDGGSQNGGPLPDKTKAIIEQDLKSKGMVPVG